MALPYQMNMARGHVLSLDARRRWRRWLAVYFLLVLVALGVSVGLLARDGFALALQRERIDVMERQYLNERPGVTSVNGAMRQLSRDMAACESQLVAIDGFRKEETRAGAILLGLVRVMPAGVDLALVSIDGPAAKLGIEVHVPVGRKLDESITPPRLIALWNAEPLLAGRATHFTSDKSERVQVGGHDMMKWQFTGLLGGGQ